VQERLPVGQPQYSRLHCKNLVCKRAGTWIRAVGFALKMTRIESLPFLIGISCCIQPGCQGCSVYPIHLRLVSVLLDAISSYTTLARERSSTAAGFKSGL